MAFSILLNRVQYKTEVILVAKQDWEQRGITVFCPNKSIQIGYIPKIII